MEQHEHSPKYHQEFLKSPHHMILGFLTLGLGFMSAEILPLIAGATVYVLGWIYLPDLGFFRRWVDRRKERERRAVDAAKVTEFVQRREGLLTSLAPERRQRYGRLALVCRDIEKATSDNLMASADAASDPRLRKLDELMWTYLRLLGIEESLEKFLETERREKLDELIKESENEVARLNSDLEEAKAKKAGQGIESRQRYLASRQERLEVLRKRHQRTEQAESNLALVVSEQERLDQQIKLLRADAVATKNAETLTARIDATVMHLDQTNKWLSEMDEFKDLVGDMPGTQVRVGYETSAAPPLPPVIPTAEVRRQAPRHKQAQ